MSVFDNLNWDYVFCVYIACCFLVPYGIYLVGCIPDWLDDLRLERAIRRHRRARGK